MSSRTFESWMAEVDVAVSQIAFVSVHDLPDLDFRSLYEGGESPQTAAREAQPNNNHPLWPVRSPSQ